MKRLIVGISGASGAIYGVRLLQVLRDVTDIETHLVMSQAARQTLSLETDFSLREVQALADVTHALDFALLDEFFFLYTDALQQDGSRFVIRVLWYKLAMNSEVEDFGL